MPLKAPPASKRVSPPSGARRDRLGHDADVLHHVREAAAAERVDGRVERLAGLGVELRARGHTFATGNPEATS
jgi:hypothetical protein